MVGFSSGLDVEFDVRYVVLEKQKQTCIECNSNVSRRDAQHHRTKRQRTKDKNLASHVAASCEKN